MDRTGFGSNMPSASREEPVKAIRSVFRAMIRTGMFVDFLLEDLEACRTEAEKEIVCFALKGAKTRIRHLHKSLKRLLASEACGSADFRFVAAEDRVNPFFRLTFCRPLGDRTA